MLVFAKGQLSLMYEPWIGEVGLILIGGRSGG